MSSCVVQVPSSLLKRVRPSLGDEAEHAAAKVGKPWMGSSPRACMERPEASAVAAALPPTASSSSSIPWPDVRGCAGVRKALAFLNKSRQHAVLLMVQNHWERAIGVLEKIEAATENVSVQRRRVVIDQANAARRHALLEDLKTLELRPVDGPTSPSSPAAPRRPRAVRFSADVDMAPAEDMDRACDPVAAPQREEMLVLRASRTIPQENLSEFWDN